ncbi:hypothetical protein PRK78_005803 [Emydomyces testavorans]|uniref:Prp 4 CRoW domain-containing protein n=1 Tax=Emydomyces testavorans TaxID=2070801 RepID=A0AAF0DKV9_9EURO|nr:hypothetical protein PRK78_005803 [Emydomyces testavorans]
MHFSLLILLSGVAAATSMTGDHTPEEVLAKLQNRQVELCKEIKAPYTCERSCGPGFTECGSFPHCYNPSRGETCCRNGKYCPAGYFCTDAGCCPSSKSLQECGATQILTGSPPTSSKGPLSFGGSSSAIASSSTSRFSLNLSTPTQLSSPPSETLDNTPTTTTRPNNPLGAPAASSPARQSANSAGRLEGGVLMGGLGMLAMVL